MKFLALSALAAFGFLAQNSESTLFSNNIFSSFGLNNPVQNTQGSNPFFSGTNFEPLNPTFNQNRFNNNQNQNKFNNNQNRFNNNQNQNQFNNNQNRFNNNQNQNQFNNNQNPFNNNQNPFNNQNQNQFNNNQNPFNNQNQNQFNNNQNPFNNNQNPFNNNQNQNQFNNNQNPFNNNQNPFNNNQNQNQFNNNQNNVTNQKFNQNNVSNEILRLRSINRSFDGTGNNLKNPRWGATGSPLQRLCAPNYQDGKSIIWQNAPEPRLISNFVGQVQGPVNESSLGNNMLFTIWGQFLDHDLSLSQPAQGKKAQVMNIKIPKCDFFFDKQCTGIKEFPFSRSERNNANVRTNINLITAWLDGSQVYGSSKKEADDLRELKNGKMKVSEGNILPKNQKGKFLAGDSRAEENTALAIFHTLFVRQHNRLCDIIVKRDPKLSDEDVYQMARHYVIGLLQHITYDEYLPELIGKENMDRMMGPYRYDQTEKPNIFTEFSAAAFRIGHPLINSPIKTTDNSGNLIRSFPLKDLFFNTALVTSNGVTQFLNGLARTPGKERSIEIIDDIRNFLNLQPISTTIDLFSFNLQRGRDHGICSIKGARQKLGLSDQSIRQIFNDQQKARILQLAYHDIDNVDLWLGIIGQKKRPDAVMGELGIAMSVFQFQKIRNSDRLWYETAYPQQIVKEIKATTFGDVIKRNSGVNLINRRAFKTI